MTDYIFTPIDSDCDFLRVSAENCWEEYRRMMRGEVEWKLNNHE